jgi:hypothetical protein
MNPAFCGASAHIGLLELPRTSVSGHNGRTGEVLDVGATLAGSSDENPGLVSGMSARPLIALGRVVSLNLVYFQQYKKRAKAKGNKKCHTETMRGKKKAGTTSRLLASSLSLGVPVPRPTQCVRGV